METSIRKRIVLHHSTGRLKDLHQIVGLLEGSPAEVAAAILPSFTYPKTGEHSAHHAKTKPRYIGYREWAQTPVGHLNDFNPAQV